jgi:hypothetical protein
MQSKLFIGFMLAFCVSVHFKKCSIFPHEARILESLQAGTLEGQA